MVDPVLARLDQIELKLDAVLTILSAMIEDSGIEMDDLQAACPNCGGDRLEDTTDFGQPKRLTCLTIGCGKSFQPQEASNG